MKVEVITSWYNERVLAPLFFNHYRWADKIVVLLEKSTNDGTRDVIESASRTQPVEVRDTDFPDGLDDLMKTGEINKAVNASDADWMIVVDSDEFVYPAPYGKDPRAVLATETGNYILSRMWDVWRHESDGDIDPSLPPVPQRIHGEPDLTSMWASLHHKPCIFRRGAGLPGIGCHVLHDIVPLVKSTESWHGAHWCSADPCFSVERRVKFRQARLSQENIKHGRGTSSFTEEQLLDMCRAHLGDPVVIQICAAVI